MERCVHEVLDRDQEKGHVPAEKSCLRTNILYDIAPGLKAVLDGLHKPEPLDRARVDNTLILNGLGE
jgi:hypothetical protein